MIDIHSHLIFDVDDGASTIEKSINMVQFAEKAGVTAIIATPHFHKGIFDAEKVNEKFRELYYRVRDSGVKLYLGYEVRLDTLVYNAIKNEDYPTLAQSRYMLLDFPVDALHSFTYDLIFMLQLRNIIPIISHPERIKTFAENFDKLQDLLQRGCVIQIDAASILGIYGPAVKKLAKKLIQSHMAYFAASNAHYAADYEWFQDAFYQVAQWGGEEYAREIFEKNPSEILADEGGIRDVRQPEIKKAKFEKQDLTDYKNKKGKLLWNKYS